ncbi:MAG: DNA-directed RNA polymerase [DPANN group archaeon]|nr:DNA-directed RNA polymerase [DPANN group archaeon]
MFELVEFKDTIRVLPKYLGTDINASVKMSLADKYENNIINDIGVILAISSINTIGDGRIIIDDASVHYDIEFNALVYNPKLHEVIIGEVVDITSFGVFVRFGPIDGLCHVSQVINDFVTFDDKSKMLVSRESKKSLKVGDNIKARIIAVSLDKKEINKINLTMRQPGLGAISWLEDDRQNVINEANKKDIKETDKNKNKKEVK